MPIDDEKSVSIREMQGVNQADDARINEPGHFWVTKNYYAKFRGVLSPRPGSKQVAYQVNYLTRYPDVSIAGVGGLVTSVFSAGGGLSAPWPLIHDSISTQASLITPKPILPFIARLTSGPNPTVSGLAPFPLRHDQFPTGTAWTPTAPSALTGASRISGLARVYIDEGTNRWLVGAMTHEPPYQDQLFYVFQASAGVQAQIYNIPTIQGQNTVSHAEWQILPFRYYTDPNTTSNSTLTTIGYWAIATNGVDRPFGLQYIGSAGSATLPPFEAKAIDITTNETIWAAAGTTGGSDNAHKVVAIQSMCIYGGSLVYGGYKLYSDGLANFGNFDNFIAFADPGKPYKLSSDTASTYNVQIGDHQQERVTAVVPNGISSDSQGTTSQLCAFTAKRVRTFTGYPPVSGSQSATNFTSIPTGDVGCVAPRTICQTPSGLIFLGTDGYIYLIPENGRPTVISRALQNVFGGMSLRRMRGCCAFYKLGWYVISFPGGNVKDIGKDPIWTGSISKEKSQTFRNDSQYYGDLRFLQGGPFTPAGTDSNVNWYGPMIGQYVSCFAIADGPEDNKEVYAGWDHAPVISQVWMPEMTTDPSHNDPTVAVNNNNQMVLGEMDFGDPHIEKEIISVSLGVQTDAPANITMTLVSIADNANTAQGYSQVFPVNPAGSAWNTGTWNTNFWTDEKNFSMIALRPPTTIRGRCFRLEFSAAASGSVNPRVQFSDIKFRYREVPRKP